MLFVEVSETVRTVGPIGFFYIPITAIMAFSVLYKAIKLKQKMLYIFFLTLLFTPTSWYPSQIGYIYWLFTQEALTYQTYVLMGTLGIPVAMLSWLYIYLTTIKTPLKKLVLSVYGIISIVFYVFLLYFLLIAPGAPIQNLIAMEKGPLDVDYQGIVLLYMIISVFTGVISGIHFSIVSMRSDSKLILWKGRFLLMSFIAFGIGAFGDAIITLLIFRVLLLISSVLFYIGFIMPNWMKRILSLK